MRDLPPSSVPATWSCSTRRGCSRLGSDSAKPTGGAVEVLLLEQSAQRAAEWEALVRPSRKVPPGIGVRRSATTRGSVVGDDLGDGRRRVELLLAEGVELLDVLDRHGEVPLPPYITRRPRRSRALPDHLRRAAGLGRGTHRGPAPHPGAARGGASGRRARGARRARGGARHVPAHRGRHASRTTRCTPSATACRRRRCAACERAERVVAIGTTSVRALESAAATGRARGEHRPVHPRRPALRAWSTR